MQIRKLNKHTFDVFTGNGFDNWSRVRRFHWGFKVIDGIPLSRHQKEEILTACEQNPKGSLQNVG